MEELLQNHRYVYLHWTLCTVSKTRIILVSFFLSAFAIVTLFTGMLLPCTRSLRRLD
jgi:hypothetical protein